MSGKQTILVLECGYCSLREAQSRKRKVLVFMRGVAPQSQQFAPIFILDVMVRETLIDHLQPFTPGHVVLNGELNINPSFSEDV